LRIEVQIVTAQIVTAQIVIAQIGYDIEEILPKKRRQHEAVVQRGAPAGQRP